MIGVLNGMSPEPADIRQIVGVLASESRRTKDRVEVLGYIAEQLFPGGSWRHV